MKYLSNCLIIIILLLNFVQTQADERGRVTERFIAAAIQGDLPRAGAILSDAAGDPDAAMLLEQFQRRFIDGDEPPPRASGDAFIDELAGAYREYWRRALMRREALVDAERTLQENLADLLGDGRATWSSGAAGSAQTLATRIGAAGYHHFRGPAPPVNELLLWQTEERASYSVALTDQTRTVLVVFMDDFQSLGWKHYATLGLATTTGWVDGDTLYCLAWAYDRRSESFRVSYLKHETRHLVDLELFPGLTSVELEYRAKLTELAFATTTQRRLLADFLNKSAANPQSPHAEANDRVMRDLYKNIHGRPLPDRGDPWSQTPAERVNRAARRLLQQNTNLLRAGR